MNKLNLPLFNIDVTLMGGQTFTFCRINEGYVGFTTETIIVLKKISKGWYWQTYPNLNDERFIYEYFDNKNNYDFLDSQITDENIVQARKELLTLRILKQDFVVTLLSFILSSNNNIVRVRGIIQNIAKRYGEKVATEFGSYYLFPSLDVLSKLSMKDLEEFKMGYRTKYFYNAVQKLKLGEYVELEREKNFQKFFEYLVQYNGIGEKVADCILLYSQGFLHVMPVDLWIFRIFKNIYGIENKKPSEIKRFANDKYNNLAGYAGQYLFEKYRQLSRKS